MRYLRWGATIVVAIVIALWGIQHTAPPSGDTAVMARTIQQQYPQYRSPEYRFRSVLVEPGIAGVVVIHSGKAVAKIEFHGDTIASVSPAGWGIGPQPSRWLWYILLATGIQLAIWWRTRWCLPLVGVHLWAGGVIWWWSSAYVMIAQAWVTGGALVGAGVAGWWLTTGKTSLSSTATSEEQRTRLLLLGLVGVAVLCWSVLSLSTAVDVATSNLEGATRLLHGSWIYGHDTIVFHGDTYPPFTYVAYLLGALITPVQAGGFFDVGGAIGINLMVTMIVAGALWRRSPRAAVSWIWAVPVLHVAGSGSNDLLLAGAIVLAAYHYRWAMALAAGLKIIPLLWSIPWLRQYGRAGWIQYGVVACSSIALLFCVGGVSAILHFVHAISFQGSRFSLNDPATLYGWSWWHPLLQTLFGWSILATCWIRGTSWRTAAVFVGCMTLASAQYVNPLYTVWVWALWLGLAALPIEEKTPSTTAPVPDTV
jgi:hypothetical protein